MDIRHLRRNCRRHVLCTLPGSVANLNHCSIAAVCLTVETTQREQVAGTSSFYRNPNYELQRVLENTYRLENPYICHVRFFQIHTRAVCPSVDIYVNLVNM